MQTLGIFGTVWEYKQIDVELTYRIIVNAITGEKSVDALLTYVAGLSATRYTVGGQLVDLTNIQIRDSIPELTYAMVLLSDQHRLREWCKFFYLSLNAFDTVENIYFALFHRSLRLFK